MKSPNFHILSQLFFLNFFVFELFFFSTSVDEHFKIDFSQTEQYSVILLARADYSFYITSDTRTYERVYNLSKISTIKMAYFSLLTWLKYFQSQQQVFTFLYPRNP